jgi:hypothetical protein
VDAEAAVDQLEANLVNDVTMLTHLGEGVQPRARGKPHVSFRVGVCRKNEFMRVMSSFVRQMQVRSITTLGVLLSFAVGQMTWAGVAVVGASQTVMLHPASTPELRIDFDYNFQKALPPFEKEPALLGKEVARGIIPTLPPTPFLRNISDNELYLSTGHTQDFADGKSATYLSFYRGHIIFTNLAVTSIRNGLEIPYTLELFTYEHGCAGWLNVRSGWTGEFAVAGQPWRLTVVDNLDGHIGRDDTLHLQRLAPTRTSRRIAITPIPGTLFLDGHAFNLGFTFKEGEKVPMLEAVLTETNLPLGRLSVAARGCTAVCLSNECLTAVLDATAGASPIPPGTYRITDCLLEESPGLLYQPTFIGCDRTVVIAAGQAASLAIGPPLRNTVQVTRQQNLLRLTYQLLGQAGEQYEYYDWKARPHFAVWKGPVRIGTGTLPFG